MKTPAMIVVVLFCMGGTSFVHADRLFSSSSLGYSMYLPDNWIVESVSDSQDFMYDTTGAHGGLLSIIRQRRNTLDFPEPQDWVRAHFIGYLLVTQYSYNPWGAILYRDSSSTCTQGNLWASEAFGRFYSLDSTMGSWSEFVRFTANEKYGYQLFAISDTADMESNLTTYAALLYGISIESSSNASPYRSVASIVGTRANVQRMVTVTLSGRLVPTEHRSPPAGLASGLICAPGFKLPTTPH